jgi:hypothetical protein
MNERRFYVYVLFRLDGSPCYIGKGAGRRWLIHEAEAYGAKHRNKRLAKIITDAAPKRLPKIKLQENLTNAEACAVEVALIAAIGRGYRGPLVNMTDGGEGTVGRPVSADARRRIGKGGEKRKGRKTGPQSPERRLAISRAKRGKPAHPKTVKILLRHAKSSKSETHRKAISEANKAIWEERKRHPDQYEAHCALIRESWIKRKASTAAPLVHQQNLL